MAMDYANLKLKSQRKTIKSEDQKLIETAKKRGFPNCKGLYPECPKLPRKDGAMCRGCPVLD